MKPRLRSFFLALLTIVLATAVALVLAEAALRLAGIGAPQFYAYDAERGVRHRAGAQGLYREEGEALVQINSAGLRSREHTLARPPGVLRIAVLGDSFAEAFSVPLEQTFWAVMEAQLQSCPALRGRRAEAINFGVSGYGTSTEWIALQREGWAYDPDIVLLAFFSGNDLRNNVPQLERKPYRLYHALREGRLVAWRPASDGDAAVHGIVTRAWRALADVSRVAQLANQARRLWVQSRLQDEARKAAGGAAGLDAGIDTESLRPPGDPTWTEAWRITEAVIAGIAQDVRQRGRLLHVASISSAIQVHPEEQQRQAFMRRVGVTSLDYADTRLAALAGTLGVGMTATAPPLRAWAQAHGRCVHGFANARPCFGHWNAEGHRLAGELLARELCARLPEPR